MKTFVESLLKEKSEELTKKKASLEYYQDALQKEELLKAEMKLKGQISYLKRKISNLKIYIGEIKSEIEILEKSLPYLEGSVLLGTEEWYGKKMCYYNEKFVFFCFDPIIIDEFDEGYIPSHLKARETASELELSNIFYSVEIAQITDDKDSFNAKVFLLLAKLDFVASYFLFGAVNLTDRENPKSMTAKELLEFAELNSLHRKPHEEEN